ncbi:hypothetical protein BH23PLA1_BH23PLA1_13440 [soil metagenome]
MRSNWIGISRLWSLAIVFSGLVLANEVVAADAPRTLTLRTRVESPEGSGRYRVVEQAADWDLDRTAIIVCDMWDVHHSLNATHRGAELVPRMDQVLRTARDQGALIIHAPSGCMDAYEGHPARQRAIETPRSGALPPDIGKWCYQIPFEEKGTYPIDQTEGGVDDNPVEHERWAARLTAMGRDPGRPWKMQTPRLSINPDLDVISDDGEEIWSLLEHRGIEHVILLGVHTNMCVLGRPFGLRRMAENGKDVVLMRDMTDTMYDPRRAPFVSHFTGTDLIVEHIEKFVCPTITSVALIGGAEFRFRDDRRPHVVFIVAEDEYETEITLPEFAAKELGKNYRVSFVLGDDDERNALPGIQVLDDADLAVISVRRRLLPTDQLETLRRFIAEGKPVIGIRTASHAFSLRGDASTPEGLAAWPEIDAEVFGGNYTNHHRVGPKTRIEAAPGAKDHPILSGVDLSDFQSVGSLYKVRPLADSTTPLLIGSIPVEEPEPVAWTNLSGSGGRVFYTSLGHKDDFLQPQFRKLLRNAIDWAVDLKAPTSIDVPARTDQ